MVDTIKTNFRASYGLDAADEKIINVATPDRTVLSDGVNVDFIFQENTIQQYKETRGYLKDFAVIFNDKIWTARQDIPSPSGTFNEAYWEPIRVDPKWVLVQGGTRDLQSGDYLTVDTLLGNPIEFTLPAIATDGDTIVIRDVGGRPGFSKVLTKASSQSIKWRGQLVREHLLTIPFAEMVFIYNNRLWNLFVQAPDDTTITASTEQNNDIQAGQSVLRRYVQLQPINIRLPQFANHGDMIQFVGMDKPTVPYFHCIISTFDNTTSVGDLGRTTLDVKYALNGYFIFNANTNLWGLYDGNVEDRLRTVNADTLLYPNETVSVVGQDNTTVSTVTLTLPNNVQPGDQITVALNYMRKGQTVRIIPSGTDKILTDQNMMQFPKRSSYPPDGNWVNTTELSFNGNTSYPPIITFAYIPMGPISQWMVVQNVPQLERVDPTTDATRARLGVIALANQTQANLDKENISTILNPLAREVALTPETLANRVSLENRRGIARLATTAEVNQASTATYLDDVIVTPKKLNERAATETMRGLAEIATQAETNAGTDDTTIITPKKLEARRATETMAGISKLVAAGGLPVVPGAGKTRDSEGTGVYAFSNHTDQITPRTLRDYKATELSTGAVYIATEAETIAGTASTNTYPIVVSPEQLHKKTATEGRIGFSEIATQAETDAGTDDFRFITPKKLSGRGSTETLTGVARIATQLEFDNGVLDNVIATPLKIKTRFNNTDRTSVSAVSGLVEAGTLWDHYTLDILEASETQRGTLKLSTQVQTNAGTDDITAVTPKKLHSKKSTQTTEGIIRTATNAEATTGTSTILAITPATLKYIVQTETTWEASTALRGFVKMTEGALTWSGTDVLGSTKPLEEYLKTGYAISPYELNKTLINYMPLKAKAVDSDKLDGLDSLQFIRRDIDQTVNGALTLTQPLTANNTSLLKGVVTIGDTNATNDTVIQRLKIATHATDVNFVIGTIRQSVDASARLRIGYKYLANANAIDVNAVEIKHDGAVSLYNNLSVTGTTTLASTLTVQAATNSNSYALGGLNFATKSGSTVTVNNTSNALILQSSDAGQIIANDASGNSRVLTEKNFVEITDRNFVNQAGDTMTGRLTINAPMSSTFTGVTSANVLQKPTAQSIGTWTVEITDPAIYNQLNGYLVPIYVNHPDTGNPVLSRYDEVKAPGTLSQFGIDKRTAYQIWVPKPTVTTLDHNANTMWIRHFNVAKDDWDGFARMYTSNLPPTAADIGAMSNDGSAFNNLRIRDWIQIGNVRIYADPASRSVKFDWVD